MQSASIKKSVLRYAQCPLGGLHNGQVMNLVCVDSKCNRRGLVCPICRMETHQNHQILPIKTFLQSIRLLFTQSDNHGDLNNLSDYLRALDIAKRQILTNLKIQVEKLAKQFKDLEQKIQQHFSSIRKNVLIQSTVTTKLPTLLSLLSEEQANKDSQYLQEQFKKYTELLKYQNQKLIISDKAKAIVQNYAIIPSKFSSALQNDLKDFMKKLSLLPKFFQEKQSKNQKVSAQLSFSYNFSSQNKYFDFIIQQNGKLVKTSQQCEQMGYAFVIQNKGVQNQKITFQIVQNYSNMIIIGLGDVTLFQNCAFMADGSMEDNVKTFNYINSNGSKNEKNNNFEEESGESYSQNNKGLIFDKGNIVEVELIQNQLIYTNKTTNTSYRSKAQFTQQSKKNIQFVVGLCQGDSIRILNN